MLYPQNGDRMVIIDYATSLHPTYIAKCRLFPINWLNPTLESWSRTTRDGYGRRQFVQRWPADGGDLFASSSESDQLGPTRVVAQTQSRSYITRRVRTRPISAVSRDRPPYCYHVTACRTAAAVLIAPSGGEVRDL